MREEICSKCPIFNDGFLQLGIRKTCKVEARLTGNKNSDKRLLIWAEAPGSDECQQNSVLVGRAGKELDKLLIASGLDKFSIRLTNVVKCRPIEMINNKDKNRAPTENEVAACSPYLEEDWAFDPHLTITLGKVPTKALLPQYDPSLIRGRGITTLLGGKERLVLSSFHPAACLYQPSNRPILLKHLTNASMYLEKLDMKELNGA